MNRKTAAVLLLTCVASPLAAQAFEGTVSMNVTDEDGSSRSISYMIKGGKLRFEPGGGQVSVIIEPATHRMTIIMNAQKMYMERDIGGGTVAAPQRAAGANPSVVRTGRMETIAGYKCEHVIVTDDDGASVDSCMSSELGGFRMPAASNPMAPQKEAGWLAELGPRGFPLKAEKGGKVIMVVTAIEKKAMDAALFTAPDGYQLFAMPVRPRRPRQG